MSRPFLSAALVAGGLLAAGQASASDWTVTMGGRAQAVIPYEGAGHNVLVPVPVLQVRRSDEPDRPSLPGDALGVALVHVGGFYFGPSVRARGKRNDKDDRAGLRQVNLAIEPGAFVTFWPTDWLRLHVDGGRGVRGHRGWVGDGGFDVVMRSGRWTASLGPRVGFGDEKYMDAYFGVTPAEALANAAVTSAYAPSGGRRYAGGVSTLAYRVSDHWMTTANFSYHRLAERAALSPIVQTIGSRDEFAGGLGLKYTFGWGG